jgi:hypothetical protein
MVFSSEKSDVCSDDPDDLKRGCFLTTFYRKKLVLSQPKRAEINTLVVNTPDVL